MMNCQKNWPKPRLFIVRMQVFFEKWFHIPLLTSFFLLAFPLIIIGVLIQLSNNYPLFSRGVIFSLSWLAIAPFLLRLAYYTVAIFFDNNRFLFLENDDYVKKLQKTVLDNLGSPRYLFISIPLTLISVLVLIKSIYASAPIIIVIWVCVTFGLLFFIAGMGFWGIFQLGNIVGIICQQRISFKPFHSDNMGGLSKISHLNIRGPLYFFSGSLLFPLVFDVIHYLPGDELITLALWVVVILFFCFGFMGFLIPQFWIHSLITTCKEMYLAQAEEKLQNLLDQFLNVPLPDKDSLDCLKIQLDTYRDYYHMRLYKIKEWPFDWQVILQFVFSISILVSVSLMEAYFGSFI